MNSRVCSKWYEDCYKLLTSYYNTIWLYSFRAIWERSSLILTFLIILLTLFNYSFYIIRHSREFSILLLFHSVYHNRFPWTIMYLDWFPSMLFDWQQRVTVLGTNVEYFLYTLLLLYTVKMKSRDAAKSAINWYIVTRRYIREWVRETDTP